MTDQPLVTIRHGGEAIDRKPGESVSFGRARTAEDVVARDVPHLGLSENPRLHALAGRIDVDDLGWTVTNTGRWLHVRVAEVGTPNRFEVPPGRTVRVPYPDCRMEVTTGDETVGFDVCCPWLGREPRDSRDAAVPLALAGSTVTALGLDRSAGYFRALVALCAPRLRDPQSAEVATEGEIARTLNQLPEEVERVTVKAVERRLANVRRKVGLVASDPYGGSVAGLEIRDASQQLADLAIRTGAVTAADLDLIEPAPADDADPGDLSAGESARTRVAPRD